MKSLFYVLLALLCALVIVQCQDYSSEEYVDGAPAPEDSYEIGSEDAYEGSEGVDSDENEDEDDDEDEDHEDHDEDDDDEDEEEGNCNACHLTTDEKEFDLKLLETFSYTTEDYSLVYSACKDSPCGASEATVCLSYPQKDVSISYGSLEGLTLIPGNAAERISIEATYGEGEMCTNGSPRKTVVEYKCSYNLHELEIQEIEVDDCFINMVVSTPHACDTSIYCSFFDTEEECNAQTGLCRMQDDGDQMRCLVDDSDQEDDEDYVIDDDGPFVVLLLFFGGLFGCSLCLCACAMSKRRKNALRRQRIKKLVKNAQKKERKVSYVPLDQEGHVQLVPAGQFVPMTQYRVVEV